MDIEIRYFDDCPNWRDVHAVIDSMLGDLGIDAVIELTLVDTQERAEALSFRGSPTVLIDGVDPWDDPNAPVGLSCRIYRTPDGFAGTPPEAVLREELEARR